LPPAAIRDPGPLVRAFEEARERRESARLPAAAPPPRPLPSRLANDDTDAFDRLELEAIARATPPPLPEPGTPLVPPAPPPREAAPAAPPSRPPAEPPRPEAPRHEERAAARPSPFAGQGERGPGLRPAPPEPLDEFGTFDIDEALRLLDNAPDAPAPAGAAAAPPPSLPPIPDESGEIAFDDIDSDIAEIEAALEPPRPSPPAPAPTWSGRAAAMEPLAAEPPPPRPAAEPRPSAGAAESAPPRPAAASRPKRGAGEDFLAPLDPAEALSILESVKGPGSDESVFARPPLEPVSDELEPLDPNEALSLLHAARPAPPAAPPPPPRATPAGASSQRMDALRGPAPAPAAPPAGKTGTRILPAFQGTPPPAQAAAPAPSPAAPPRKPGATKSGGYKADLPVERIALSAADLADSQDALPIVEPPPAPERPSPAQRANAMSKTGALGGPVRLGNPPGKRPSGERAALKKPLREPGGEEPVHGLVLSKIAGEGKRQKAAELIAEIAGMTKDEALKLTDRTIIPVLKGVTREEAEAALARFQRSRISGRVTTRRIGE
jgi:hypothetical protein